MSHSKRISRESGWLNVFSLILCLQNGVSHYYELVAWRTYPVEGDVRILDQFPPTEDGLKAALAALSEAAFADRMNGLADTEVALRAAR